MGGVCILIYTSCCTYLDQSGQIAEHIHSIWQHPKVLPEVTKDITSWSKYLWETLTSWLPNLKWLTQCFVGNLGILIPVFKTSMMSSVWYCKQTATTQCVQEPFVTRCSMVTMAWNRTGCQRTLCDMW